MIRQIVGSLALVLGLLEVAEGFGHSALLSPMGLRPQALRSAASIRTSPFKISCSVSEGAEMVKADLMTQLSAGSGLKSAADPANRASVNELLLQLEPKNSEADPAESALLNGVWELLYTGSYGSGLIDSPTREIALLLYTGGLRPGLFANLLSRLPGQVSNLVEINDLELTIKRDEPRLEATAKVSVVGNEQALKLTGNLASESSVRVRETYTNAEVLGQKIEFPGPVRNSRNFFITYLDEDILVARDETGVPDVWLRKDKEFWSSESEKVEMVAPVNPEVNTDKPIEPEWTDDLTEDVGPSDY